MTSIAEKIRELRKSARMNQSQFARYLDVNQATVSRWENGTQDPGYSHLLRLANLAGVSVSEFSGQTGHLTEDASDIEVRHIINAGNPDLWPEMPAEKIYRVKIMPDNRWPNVRRVGVEVRSQCFNLVYPPGSVLITIPLDDIHYSLNDKDRLIVSKHEDKKIELSIREVELRDDLENGFIEEMLLWYRSDHPDFQDVIKTKAGQMPKRSPGIIEGLLGLVIAAIVPEPVEPVPGEA